ncbi:CynX/NimT family MFS transporter [Oryzihumus leptocrescens]|uniref:CP family cyanate transporter-like MFS transporter n=1 Tax=Oryzihumus leptocrescens TaxID=297536 RepID=A0A542ZK50_9MICO|nr:MFS transporter [Oryzihumus leptocrescens]TQL60723.1 CP family cyanate transporter-like MFS transporter [Oryzihumus leptocrescens]
MSTTTTSTASTRTLAPVWLMALALVAVAANLRTAIASVPPLARTIAEDLDLSNAWMGALTTLPVLCMGLFAPVAQRLGARIGAALSVEVAVVCVGLGTLCRLAGSHVWALYLGTFVAGVGIAIGGTLLPRLVKALFPPERAGLVTGLYMFAMMGGAAASSALAVPLQGWLGSWQASLASWSVIALVGTLAWAPVAARAARHRSANPPADEGGHGLPWRHPTAWLVAGYLTVQSFEFYSCLAWIAPSYVDRGWSPGTAGYLLSVFSAAQLISGLVAPALTDRIHDHRALLMPAAVLGLLGLLGLLLAPESGAWVWVTLLGLGQGAAFALGLVLLVDYSATPAGSGRLAAMAFFVSYTVASFGPASMGAVRDLTHGFHATWLVLATLMVVQAGLVLLMRPGRARTP